MFTVLSTKLLPLLLLVMPRRDPSSFSAQSGRSLILDPGVSASLCFLVASSPGLTQFFNVARRKTRRPGKIDHVRDVGWRELGNWPATGARARHELAINKFLSRQQSTSRRGLTQFVARR